MFQTPILFLVFNRLDTTKQVFQRIKEIQPSKLYIASDGARESRPGEDIKVNAVREYIQQNINWNCDVKTLFREKNFGCKYAVSSAIDWFFENEEMGIILEDDCLPVKSFFYFCETMLLRYKNDLSVGHIGGNNFQDGIKRGDGDYYFSFYNHIWGWASWADRWKLYDVELENVKNDIFVNDIFSKKDEQLYWKNIFQSMKEKKVDTWDFQWTCTLWYYKKKSVLPNVNLVSNIGFHPEEATHTHNPESKLANMRSVEITGLKSPTLSEVNKEADVYTSLNYFLYKPSIIKRVVNKIRRIIKHYTIHYLRMTWSEKIPK